MDLRGQTVVSGVEFPEEFDLTRGDDELEEIEKHDPRGEGNSRDGMSETDASDVPPPVHVEDEPDTMPREEGVGEFGQYRCARSSCKKKQWS